MWVDKLQKNGAALFPPLYLTLLYLAFRLPWLFTVPMKEAPDEFAHYWVIKFIHDNLRLPLATEVFAGGPSAVYGSLPQLGYLPHLFFCWLFPSSELALAERFGSLFMGLVMLYAAYKIGPLLFPSNKFFAFALPLTICLHPQLIFLHSYANNDSTSSALASLIIFLMLKSLSEGNSFRKTVTIGILSGWLAISKYSGLAILPVVALSLVASSFLHGTSLIAQIPALLSSVALAGIVCFWWFFRNYHEFNGDIMGTKTMYKTWALTFNRDLNYYLSPWRIIKDHRWWRMMFFSFWAVFGYMNIYVWRPIYFAYLAALVAAIAGWIYGLIYKANKQIDKKQTALWLSLTLVVLINLASMIWASVYNLGGPQGRYLFTSEIPVMALLIGGMSRFKGRASIAAVLIFLVLNLLVSIYSWTLLFQTYGGWHIRPL